MANWDVLHVNSLEVEHSVPHAQVVQAIEEGKVSRDDCVRKPGEERWWRIYEVPEFRGNAPEPTEVEVPPLPSDVALRGMLADAEPSQEAATRRRPAPPVAAKPAAPALAGVAPMAAVLDEPEEGLPYRKKEHHVEEELDMTPMVDVAMQLILFFMVTSSMIMQACLQFPTPVAEDGRPTVTPKVQPLDELKVDNIMVNVKKDNTIYVNDELTKDSDLAEKMAKIKREKAILGGVVVSADEDAFHEKVVAVIDAANVAELKPIKMAAPKKAKKATTKKRTIKND